MAASFVSAIPFRKENKVIQIDVSAILNTRSVSTLTKGKIVTWITGVDKENGYLTMSAAAKMGDTDPHALPDNPLYPANNHHPEILLHYTNSDGLNNQTRALIDTGEFTFQVPNLKYTDLYLSMTSSYGATSLQISMIYKDGVETREIILPDWFKDIAENDPDLSYVAHNMGKWGVDNKLSEKDHHNIDALNIHPDPKRMLTAVKIKKLPDGYLLFWAATGVVKN